MALALDKHGKWRPVRTKSRVLDYEDVLSIGSDTDGLPAEGVYISCRLATSVNEKCVDEMVADRLTQKLKSVRVGMDRRPVTCSSTADDPSDYNDRVKDPLATCRVAVPILSHESLEALVGYGPDSGGEADELIVEFAIMLNLLEQDVLKFIFPLMFGQRSAESPVVGYDVRLWKSGHYNDVMHGCDTPVPAVVEEATRRMRDAGHEPTAALATWSPVYILKSIKAFGGLAMWQKGGSDNSVLDEVVNQIVTVIEDALELDPPLDESESDDDNDAAIRPLSRENIRITNPTIRNPPAPPLGQLAREPSSNFSALEVPGQSGSMTSLKSMASGRNVCSAHTNRMPTLYSHQNVNSWYLVKEPSSVGGSSMALDRVHASHSSALTTRSVSCIAQVLDFDCFVSYRWRDGKGRDPENRMVDAPWWHPHLHMSKDIDNNLAKELFERLSASDVGSPPRTLHCFFDQVRLQNGLRVEDQFVPALIGCCVCIPVVSYESIYKFTKLKADTVDVDNLLFEWITMLELYQLGEVEFIVPIVFGERKAGGHFCGEAGQPDLFSSDVYNALPDVVCTCVNDIVGETLLSNGVQPTKELMSRTVRDVVRDICSSKLANLMWNSIDCKENDSIQYITDSVVRLINMEEREFQMATAFMQESPYPDADQLQILYEEQEEVVVDEGGVTPPEPNLPVAGPSTAATGPAAPTLHESEEAGAGGGTGWVLPAVFHGVHYALARGQAPLLAPRAQACWASWCYVAAATGQEDSWERLCSAADAACPQRTWMCVAMAAGIIQLLIGSATEDKGPPILPFAGLVLSVVAGVGAQAPTGQAPADGGCSLSTMATLHVVWLLGVAIATVLPKGAARNALGQFCTAGTYQITAQMLLMALPPLLAAHGVELQ